MQSELLLVAAATVLGKGAVEAIVVAEGTGGSRRQRLF